MTKVSCISPSYKTGKYLDGFLDSISEQTFRDFEVVLDHNDPTKREIEQVEDAPAEEAELLEEIELIENTEPAVELEEPEENLIDDALLEIFITEVTSHLEAVNDFIDESLASDFNNELSDQLQR